MSLADASNESVTNNYSAFLAATDFSLKTKKERPVLLKEKKKKEVKVASCSFENDCALLDCEKSSEVVECVNREL